MSYYTKGARNPTPFDDFQEGLRAVSRIHSSYQDEPCYISNDRALVYVCNLDNKPKIKDPYSKFNVRSKNNAHMQLLLSVITCLCICFSIFNGVTSLKQVPFFTEKK